MKCLCSLVLGCSWVQPSIENSRMFLGSAFEWELVFEVVPWSSVRLKHKNTRSAKQQTTFIKHVNETKYKVPKHSSSTKARCRKKSKKHNGPKHSSSTKVRCHKTKYNSLLRVSCENVFLWCYNTKVLSWNVQLQIACWSWQRNFNIGGGTHWPCQEFSFGKFGVK